MPKVRNNTKHTFHLFVIRLAERDNFDEFFKKNGISTAIHYPTALPFLQAYNKQNNSVNDLRMHINTNKQFFHCPCILNLKIVMWIMFVQ